MERIELHNFGGREVAIVFCLVTSIFSAWLGLKYIKEQELLNYLQNQPITMQIDSELKTNINQINQCAQAQTPQNAVKKVRNNFGISIPRNQITINKEKSGNFLACKKVR